MIGVDQLVLRRRRLRQNADPPERVFAVVFGEHAGGNARSANAVEAVAAADEVTVELLELTFVAEPDLRRSPREIVDAHIVDPEHDLAAVGEPFRYQVLHHLLLSVDRNALPDQVAEVDVVQCALEAEMNAVVEHRLALQTLADAGLDQQVGGPLLEQAGADAALDVGAAAVLQDDGLDAHKVQEVREHEAGGPGADDADLGAHVLDP